MQDIDADIIRISRFQRLNMRFALNNEVEAYWDGLRDGRPMPARSEIDPRGIERALRHTFILERVAPAVARFRLAGQHLNELMGMDVRGMPISAMITAGGRPDLARHIATLFDGTAALRLDLHARGTLRKPALDAEMLLLPLAGGDAGIDRALGCLVSNGQLGCAPRRFDLKAVQSRALTPGAAPREAPAPAPAFAEAPAPFAPAPKPATRPGLRLVHSND